MILSSDVAGEKGVKTKIEKTLPKKLAGAVCAQMVRCGKPACKCVSGALHGPYFYRFVWVSGRHRKIYVRQKDRESIKAACDAFHDERKQHRAERRRELQQWRELKASFTGLKQFFSQR